MNGYGERYMKKIEGGVCAPAGFKANGVHCGIRKNKAKRDLSLIVSDVRCAAACVYTQNLVKGAPIAVTKEHVKDGYAQAIVCNSGNANTCNADGVEIAEGMCGLVEKYAHIPAEDVVVASTGVIGQPLSLEPIESGMGELVNGLSDLGSLYAAQGIMTTDTVDKQIAYSFQIGGRECKIGAIGKGVGMICPNMATMLIFITTDAAITPAMLQKALSADVKESFNMVSVDGDTSTNDMVCVLANGMAGNEPISATGKEFNAFRKALSKVTTNLCRRIAKDGEGATKLLECKVTGAKNKAAAKTVAKSVIKSSLFKAAMFGADANWGRVLCAIGYAGADVDISKIDVDFKSRAGTIAVCRGGSGVPFSEDEANKVLSQDEIEVLISLGDGNGKAVAWGCDLTYEYVKINGDYRT